MPNLTVISSGVFVFLQFQTLVFVFECRAFGVHTGIQVHTTYFLLRVSFSIFFYDFLCSLSKETEFSMFVGDLSPDVTDNRLLVC